MKRGGLIARNRIAALFGGVMSILATMASGQDAYPDRAYIPIGSSHAALDAEKYGTEDFEEFNPGLVLSWEDRLFYLDYGAGVFRNSYGNTALTAMVQKSWDVSDDVTVALNVQFSDYGDNARFLPIDISDRVGVIPAAMVRYKNVFLQLQGPVAVVGATFPIGE